MSRTRLGEFEHAILVALVALHGDAYGAAIHRFLATHLDRDVAIGAVYTALQRLEEKGFVSSSVGDPTPVRGGRAKRFFHIEALGNEALQNSRRQAERLMLLQPLIGRS